jgi:acyl-CoA synthetase (AMP-forming)/AMP-acid ligase II
MNLSEWLMRSATRSPLAPALLTGTHVVADYAGFAKRVMHLAGGLRNRFGIGPGDRVALFLANRVEYLELFYAIWFAGAVAVPINQKLHAKEAAWIVGDAEAKVVFVDDDGGEGLVPLLKDAVGHERAVVVGSADFEALRRSEAPGMPVPRHRDDLAWLFYTSGTTGKPKGVMLSNGNLHAMAFSYFVDVDGVLPTDAALYAAPLSHGAGLYNFMHVLRGSRHVVPESGGFDSAEILSLGATLDGVSMFAAPTMVRRLVEHAKSTGGDGKGLRTIVYGGGPMYVADIEEAVAVMGPRFVQIYGQGESPMTITALQRDLVADRSHPRWRDRLASVGRAQAVVEVQVADESGRVLPPGETGEILVRGEAAMQGYWRNPEATAKTLRDGWLWTGDVGVMDEEGFLTLKDRSKDVIISGGTNIYPREVEEALLLHETVAEVSVIGRPHADWGEEVVAFVVAKPGCIIETSALDSHCLEHIARFKRPKAYHVVEALPKNNYGKVLKAELRTWLGKQHG